MQGDCAQSGSFEVSIDGTLSSNDRCVLALMLFIGSLYAVPMFYNGFKSLIKDIINLCMSSIFLLVFVFIHLIIVLAFKCVSWIAALKNA